MMWYCFDEYGRPYEEKNIYKASVWLQEVDRHVALTYLNEDVRVSTVFLSISHFSISEDPRPVLYESMAFGLPGEDLQRRYTNAEDAFWGHIQMIQTAKRILEGPSIPVVEVF